MIPVKGVGTSSEVENRALEEGTARKRARVTYSGCSTEESRIDILNEGHILNVTLLTIYGETNVSHFYVFRLKANRTFVTDCCGIKWNPVTPSEEFHRQ